MNNKTTPKDFFLHLGATVVLYSAVVAIINLAFSIINYAYPDVLAGYYFAGSIAWPISMLIVLVPLLYVLEWLIGRDLRGVPEKIDMWIRRWRIYLTLFLSGVTIIVDLITLINTYLSGEISSRFIFKVLVVLIICGIVFTYYLLSYKNSAGKSALWRNILTWVVVVLTIATVVGGFVIVGSPSKQRDIRIDNQRTNDLSNIQWQIIGYWQRDGKLPVDLSKLNDAISNYIVPVDPNTEKSYEYFVKGKDSFELCATFSQPSQDASGRGPSGVDGAVYSTDGLAIKGNDTWTHGAGRVCFERKIDPSRYPVNKPLVPVTI